MGEAIRLRPTDGDLEQPLFSVQRNFTAGQMSKTIRSKKRRKVDISQDLVAILKKQVARQK